jgi:hypothetical protein
MSNLFEEADVARLAQAAGPVKKEKEKNSTKLHSRLA